MTWICVLSTPVSITFLTVLIPYNQTVNNLSEHMNINLTNLIQWLKVTKLSLIVKKTPELKTIHRSSKNIDHNCKFMLDRKQLTLTNTVKYLGVFLNEHLLWSKQLNHITTKLNQAIGILSKLRNNTFLKTLKMTYSLFPSLLLYGSNGDYGDYGDKQI